MKKWEKPQIEEVVVENDGDILQSCWTPSFPIPQGEGCFMVGICPMGVD